MKSKLVRLCRVRWFLKVLAFRKNLMYDYLGDLFLFQFMLIHTNDNR